MSSTILTAEGIHKGFGPEGVVDGVDLAVREGEILLLMGPNGVGKTVLLSCLAGSEEPTAGDVELFETPVRAVGGRQSAFLLQDAMAVETLTGRENAAFYGALHPGFTDRWRDYATRLDLTDALDKRVATYSGGMARKLELALTMSLDVPVYLLDEPTAGVDLTMLQRFHDVILERQRAGGTVVVASHRPMDIDLADRIAFMPDGTVTAVGPPGELLDAVPPVVRVTGAEAVGAAEPFVRGGSLFPIGGEARGYLTADATVADIRQALDGGQGASVERIEPTPADLFNYYVHVRGERA